MTRNTALGWTFTGLYRLFYGGLFVTLCSGPASADELSKRVLDYTDARHESEVFPLDDYEAAGLGTGAFCALYPPTASPRGWRCMSGKRGKERRVLKGGSAGALTLAGQSQLHREIGPHAEMETLYRSLNQRARTSLHIEKIDAKRSEVAWCEPTHVTDKGLPAVYQWTKRGRTGTTRVKDSLRLRCKDGLNHGRMTLVAAADKTRGRATQTLEAEWALGEVVWAKRNKSLVYARCKDIWTSGMEEHHGQREPLNTLGPWDFFGDPPLSPSKAWQKALKACRRWSATHCKAAVASGLFAHQGLCDCSGKDPQGQVSRGSVHKARCAQEGRCVLKSGQCVATVESCQQLATCALEGRTQRRASVMRTWPARCGHIDGRCVDSAVSCAASPACQELGFCGAPAGSVEAQVSYSKEELGRCTLTEAGCEQSARCKATGECGFAKGRCVVTDAGCAASQVCKDKGLCALGQRREGFRGRQVRALCVRPPPPKRKPSPPPKATQARPENAAAPRDRGYPDPYAGYYDVSGTGVCLDYCRWVGNSGSGGDPRQKTAHGQSWWSCALATTGKEYTPRGHYTSWAHSRCRGPKAKPPASR